MYVYVLLHNLILLGVPRKQVLGDRYRNITSLLGILYQVSK